MTRRPRDAFEREWRDCRSIGLRACFVVKQDRSLNVFVLDSSYDHAVMAAGTDFRSDRLWESYITWETEQQKLANVTSIYDRVLGIPTQLYSQHFQKYGDDPRVAASDYYWDIVCWVKPVYV